MRVGSRATRNQSLRPETKRSRRRANGNASALRVKAREDLPFVERLSAPCLFASKIQSRMQARPVLLVEIVLFVGQDKVDLAALRQIDGLIKNEPAATHLRTEGQRHGAKASAAR